MNSKQKNILFYLLVLTAVFILAEISFFIQCNQVYFHDFNFISHKMPIPYTIFPEIGLFILAQLSLHLMYALIMATLAFSVIAIFKVSEKKQLKLGIGLWLFGLVSVLILNQHLFPNSKFADLLRVFVSDHAAELFYYLLIPFWGGVALVTIYALTRRLKLSRLITIGLLLAALTSFISYQDHHALIQDAATVERPNIILIGVDSLRPDALQFFGAHTKTQHIDHFLEQSTVFQETFTPIARTFPSWIAILSGKFPKESKVRFNLASEGAQAKDLLLSTRLQKEGYRTVYATDETQFSNIDKAYGFDESLTPPMGLNDFLLGTFNDFPLSNLIINTALGHWLFPHSFANRPTFMTYEPDSFLSLLKPALKKPRTKPLFLTVHFCLTHYPYLWASHNGPAELDPYTRYKAAVERVDQQLGDFLAMLQQNKVLEHAVVVLLSDHGEAFELKGDRITKAATYMPLKEGKVKKVPRFYPPSLDDEAVDQSVGHGTDVLGFSQYRTLMAFRLFGLGPQAPKLVPDYALLLDIKPTLLDFIKVADDSSGLSLKKVILGQEKGIAKRERFIFESDYSPAALRSAHPETRNLVLEGIELFTINPKTTRITVKESMGRLIISSKQYAVIDQGWVLALYPQAENKMTPVLVQLSSGDWTTELKSSFAQKAPVQKMLSTLKNFYGKEIKQLVSL